MNTLEVHTLDLRIQPEPLLKQLTALAEIGMTPEGACCRLALSEEDRLGRDLLIAWILVFWLSSSWHVRLYRTGTTLSLRSGNHYPW